MPNSTEIAFDRDAMAKWYAQSHMEIDSGVSLIFYLPTNAPDREIRFLEVNQLISEMNPAEPIDFWVDIGGAESHTLYVLDVTPSQWVAIQAGTLALPTGWTLSESRELERR